MFLDKLKRGVVLTAASLLLAGGSAVAVPLSADAGGVVPNRFYCNPNGGWCKQINGAYYAGVPIQCHWHRSATNTTGTKYYNTCTWWGPDVP